MAYQKTAQSIPGTGALNEELTRWSHTENFTYVPGIPGDTDDIATGATTITTGVASAITLQSYTNKNWVVAGTNATSALCVAAVGGGVTLTTAGADNDQTYLEPNKEGALNGIEAVKFDPGSAPVFASAITTGASVASALVFGGFVLDVAAPINWETDADQVVIALDTDTSANWYVRASIGGTDYSIDSGIAAEASTDYRFVISVDEDRIATCLINDTVVYRTLALTSGADLIPSIGVQALATAAKSMTVRKLIIAKNYEDAQS